MKVVVDDTIIVSHEEMPEQPEVRRTMTGKAFRCVSLLSFRRGVLQSTFVYH